MLPTLARIWLFVLLSLPGYGGFAQRPPFESLLEKIRTTPDPNTRLGYLVQLGEYHQSINRDSLNSYAALVQSLARQTRDKPLKSRADILVINNYLRWGKVDSATDLVEADLPNNPVKDPQTRETYFQLASLKADCFGDASNYKDALSELYQVVELAEQYHDSLVLAKNMSTIGVINYNLDHLDQAFLWYYKGLSFLGTDARFQAAAAVLYINLAETHRWLQHRDSASYYINRAIPLCRQCGNLFYLANALRVKANIFKDNKEFRAAEQSIRECMAIRHQTEGAMQLSNEQIALAGIYMHSGALDSAIQILTAALRLSDSSQVKNNPGGEVDALKISYYQVLARCYQLKGDSKNYEAVLEKEIVAKDAFYANNSARAIAELQTKYELQKKESTIIRQQLDLTRKNYLLYGSVIILSLLGVLLWLLFRNYHRKQTAKMRWAVEEEKRIAAQSILDAEEQERRRIAADLHDNIGAYASAIRADVDKISEHGLQKSGRALENLQQHSAEIINSLRDTIWVLNKENITLTGISDRIKNYIQKLQPSYPSVQINLTEDIVEDPRMSSQLALNIFRILQEALHNALKHSRATEVTVGIACHQQVAISVRDNGRGFDQEPLSTEGNGLLNMKARAREAGMKISIISNSEGGTAVTLQPTIN